MKNITIILALALTFLSSCEKEVTPVTPNTTTAPAVRDITVEYSIYAASGNIELVYVSMIDGTLSEKTENITKMNHSITFNTKSQQLISVKARNTNPSHDEVTVAIYVDGALFKSSSTTTANSWAVASGTPQ